MTVFLPRSPCLKESPISPADAANTDFNRGIRYFKTNCPSHKIWRVWKGARRKMVIGEEEVSEIVPRPGK